MARRFHVRRLVDLGPLSVWAGALPKASRVLRQLGRDTAADVEEVLVTDPALVATLATEPRQVAAVRAIIDSGLHPGDGTDLIVALTTIWPALGGARSGTDA